MKPVFWFWPSKYVKKLNITDRGITLKVSSDEFKKKAILNRPQNRSIL